MLRLAPKQRDEVVAELACHLEDFYKEELAQGRSESEAIERALSRVDDWIELARRISLAKRGEENVNIRTKCFWMPGLVSLTASMGWLEILQRANLDARIPLPHAGPPILSYFVWLMTLPIFGAMGAYLSRRVGGDRGVRLAAGLFPSIAMLGLMCFLAVRIVFYEKNGFVIRHPAYFLAFAVFPWVVFPALALLLGTLPFLKTSKPQEG
jgi:hypothetical protein